MFFFFLINNYFFLNSLREFLFQYWCQNKHYVKVQICEFCFSNQISNFHIERGRKYKCFVNFISYVFVLNRPLIYKHFWFYLISSRPRHRLKLLIPFLFLRSINCALTSCFLQIILPGHLEYIEKTIYMNCLGVMVKAVRRQFPPCRAGVL